MILFIYNDNWAYPKGKDEIKCQKKQQPKVQF